MRIYKINIILECIALLFISTLYSQDPSNRAQPANRFTEDLRVIDYVRKTIRNIDPSVNNTNNTPEITGSAYLNEHFMSGVVYYRDTVLGKHPLRYNVYAEEFELKKDTTVHTVTKTSDVEIVMNDRKFIFKYYLNENVREFGYFEVISENKKCTLLKKYRKVLTEAKPAVTSFDVDVPARFVDMEDFFILFGDEEITELKPSNKNIVKLFKTRDINIKPYLRKNDLNVKKSKDLIQVIAYCNTLL